MDFEFVKNLTPEQKVELRDILDEPDTQPKRHVELDFWDDERTQIMLLREYVGDQIHGKCMGWHQNGYRGYEDNYYQDERHGKSMGWHPNGQKHWEGDWANDKKHGKSIGWYENGQTEWETDYVNNRIHGKDVWWYEDGTLLCESYHINGQEVTAKEWEQHNEPAT